MKPDCFFVAKAVAEHDFAFENIVSNSTAELTLLAKILGVDNKVIANNSGNKICIRSLVAKMLHGDFYDLVVYLLVDMPMSLYQACICLKSLVIFFLPHSHPWAKT